MSTVVRTRFAPSPTGYLHIGGARTALFSWLFARKNAGKFILRIEDTDLERSTPEATQAILDGMHWLELDYDEGPFFQTKRMDRYREVLQQLLANGKAYRCACTKERLETLRNQQIEQKQKPRYDGFCRDKNISAEVPHVIRFLTPQTGEISFQDQVYGDITVSNTELDDLIIARTDGMPTYNFTVVVDDWDMQITHVIRGDDHINNTPRQIHILQALEAEIPLYAHLPMILGPDGKRLSKRHGAVSVMQYRDDGYLPQALLNYLVRLGWSYKDQEIFSRQEMIDYFNLRSVNKSPAACNPSKLMWLNQHYIKNGDFSAVKTELKWHFDQLNIATNQGPSLEELITIQADRAKTLREIAEKSRYFYEDVAQYDEAQRSKYWNSNTAALLETLLHGIENLKTWDKETIHAQIISIAERFSLKMGDVAQPLRIALTGNTISPPIDTTILLIGKERVLKRLRRAIDYMQFN